MAEGEKQPGGEEFWSELESIARPRVYQSGVFLFEQGTEPAGIYLIQSGQVRVFVSCYGWQKTLSEAGAGTILGMSECFCSDVHKVTAKALNRVEVSFVRRDRLMMYVREHPECCIKIVRSLSKDLQVLYQSFRLARSRASRREIRPGDEQHPGPKAR